MSNLSNSKTRFEEVYEAHQLSLVQYLPEAARKEFFALRAAKKIYADNAARTQVTLTKDKAFWELQQINETINQIEDTAELTSVMARVKELEKILK